MRLHWIVQRDRGSAFASRYTTPDDLDVLCRELRLMVPLSVERRSVAEFVGRVLDLRSVTEVREAIVRLSARTMPHFLTRQWGTNKCRSYENVDMDLLLAVIAVKGDYR